MGWVQGGEAVKQLVEFVTFMHRSEKASSYWRTYQEEVRQAAPKVFVTPAATRWGGYHDAMVRWLELEPLAREWVEKDDRMDQESRQKIAALLPDPEHTDTLKALAYALCVPRLLDLCLQDPRTSARMSVKQSRRWKHSSTTSASFRTTMTICG